MTFVDVHAHHAGAAWPAVPPPGTRGAQADAWPALAARMADADGLVAAMDAAGVDVRVLSAPPALVAADGAPAPETVRALNEHLAQVVAAHPRRLRGLATVDAFAGADAARAVEQADALGLAGVCVDCARGGEWLDAPSARPALEAAAALGLTVLAHPIGPEPLTAELAPLGPQGTRLARATAAGAGILALVRALPELPGLRVVVPLLGAGVLLLPGLGASFPRLRRDAPPGERLHLYVDTMGFDPAAIRFLCDTLGSDRVVAGTDWPVPATDAAGADVEAALAAAGLDERERALVAADTALDLFW